MLMNFKDGHFPKNSERYLCKCADAIGESFWYIVLYFNKKRKEWSEFKNSKYLYEHQVISWVRIREK